MKSVLIVDDEKMTLKLLANIVSNLGYFPILASDGFRAMQILEDNPSIAAILTDFQMPNLVGLEFIQNLRTKDLHKEIPIMVFSAYIKIKEVVAVLDKGATAFIAKPINKEEVAEFFHRNLSK